MTEIQEIISSSGNKMTEIQEIDVSDSSESVGSMTATDSQRVDHERRLDLKRMNLDPDIPRNVKNPRLEPVELIKMTQEVKEDYNNEIDPFQDLPDPLESVKDHLRKEEEPVIINLNKKARLYTCTQEVQVFEPNLVYNNVSKFITEMHPLANTMPNEMILGLPTHCQKKVNIIKIPKVLKLKQVFPRILKKTSNSQAPQVVTIRNLPAAMTTSAPSIPSLIPTTEYVKDLTNVGKVSKTTETHFEDREVKPSFHDRESQVEEEFFTDVKEQNMSIETLTNIKILKNPYFYTGLYGRMFSSFVSSIIKGCNESCRDVLMTLMKIRLDDSFSKLEDLFGVPEGQARTIFERNLLSLATFLKNIVCPPEAPDKKIIIIHRRNDSIIDYFYVRIHAPGDWRHDNCESVKFLVSCTVDGVINFVSPWYPKNEKDLTVLRSSGYLEKLEKGITVIANRKFNGVQKIFGEKNCILLDPCTAQKKFRVDTLAGYREKLRLVFDSLREFECIGFKACINKDDLNYLNHILIIASAIANS